MNLETEYSGAEAGVKAAGPANHAWFVSYLLSSVSSGMTSPLIPLFVVLYLHASVVDVGNISSIASAASVPALIFWGNLSDSLGKRKIFLLIGFMGSFLSLLLILIVTTIGMYILTLIIFQILAMASTPVATLLILESTIERRWPRVMASFNTVSYVGIVAGLIAGTFILNLYGHSDPNFLPELYVIAAIIYFFAGVSAWLLLPEPGRKIHRYNQKLAPFYFFRTVERIRYFPGQVIHTINLRRGGKKLAARTKLYIFYTAVLMFGFQLYFIPFPVFLLNTLHGNETQVFIMYLINNIASAVAFRVSGRTMNTMGVSRTLSMGLFARVGIIGFSSFLAFALIGFTYSLWLAVMSYAMMGFFWSFISISWVSSISKLAVPENRGKAIGYYNSFLGVGQIASGVVSGLIAFSFGYGVDFALASLAVLIGAIFLVRFQLMMNDMITSPDRNNLRLPFH